MATTIKKAAKLSSLLVQLEKNPNADKAQIAELQALLYGSGWHTVNAG